MITDTQSSGLTGQLILKTIGDGGAAGLGFLAILVISTHLTVSGFGQFNIALSFILVASQLTGLGTTRAMVRFASGYLRADRPDEANQVVRLALAVTFAVSLLVAAVFILGSGFASATFFHNPGLAPHLRIAGAGIVAVSLAAYFKAVLHAHQRFLGSIVLQTTIDAAKLLLALLFVGLATLDPLSAVAVFAMAPVGGIAVGLAQLRQTLFRRHVTTQRSSSKELLVSLLAYGRWVFVSRISVMALSFTGLFMLANMSGDHDAGIYGLALNLNFAFAIFTTSLSSVLLPKVSRFTKREEFTGFLRTSLRTSTALGVVALPCLFLAYPLVPWIFGERYLPSIPVFIWLSLGSIVLTINLTLRILLYSLNEPRLLAIVDSLRFMAMIGGCAILIPAAGVVAPAFVALATNLVVFGVLVIAVLRRIAAMDNEISSEEPQPRMTTLRP